ncbi:uncharacterized protein LOC144654673 isoform X1 [Oculina patagonica]
MSTYISDQPATRLGRRPKAMRTCRTCNNKETSYTLPSSTGHSSPCRMVLHSTSENKEEAFLPSITDNNGSKSKQKAKRGAKTKKKGSRNKKQKDAFVRFPELATDNGLTKNSAKTFARKSSSPKATLQSQEILKKSQSETAKFTTHERRRGNLHLPSLASTTLTSESARSKPTERWSIALGLRDSYEIPRSVFNKLTDDILKIDRQMREEAKIKEIREQRMISREWMETELSSSEGTFGRTSNPRFSYFPCLQTKSTGDRAESMSPHWAKGKISERMIHQEREIERKLREFKHRHSLSRYKDVK